MDRIATASIACAIAAAALPAQAIIMRHDRPEARYRELGERYRPYVVQLALPSQSGAPLLFSGMGTLVAPEWVLTAAHAARVFTPAAEEPVDMAQHWVFVHGRGYRVKAVFLHPDYKRGEGGPDIALLKLTTPVHDPQLACLYDRPDEVGQVVTNVGMGLPGDGLKGVGSPDGVLRGGQAHVDRAAPRFISWKFRPPDDPLTPDLEGISGPGDSGGPAFIAVDGKPCVAGVSADQDTNGGEEGRYGVTEYYARVSALKPWVEATIRANP